MTGNYFRDQIFQEIQKNSENHEQGYFNCIPFEGMARLERLIPGIEQGTYYLLTASSGVGKSKLMRHLFIHTPWTYLINNPQYGIELDIYYFSLEESKRKVILSETSKYLYKTHDKVVSIKQLQSKGRYNYLDRETLSQVEDAEDYINAFLEKVKIIDDVRSPTAIFNYMRRVATRVGRFYDRFGRMLTEADHTNIANGVPEAMMKIGSYKKLNPKHYIIVIVDHISLLTPETIGGKVLTQWQTISKFSSEYCIAMRDKYDFIPVIVQQQAAAKEQVEVNFKGQTIAEKLEPSLDGLGDNKTTQRDANVILGLFSPHRYRIEEHRKYDINYWRNNYRSLNILKDRDGETDGVLPLYFNGAVDYFKEMPSNDTEGIAEMSQLMQELNLLRRERGENV